MLLSSFGSALTELRRYQRFHTSPFTGVSLGGVEGHCFKNIIFLISVVGHGFRFCSSGRISTLQLSEKPSSMACIQDTIKCAHFRNEGNNVISSNVELICCAYQQDRPLIALQIIGLVFSYLLEQDCSVFSTAFSVLIRSI